MSAAGVGIHKVDLAPGVESTMLHTHAGEAEWIYILSGSAVCVLGWAGEVEEHEVRTGDFIGACVRERSREERAHAGAQACPPAHRIAPTRTSSAPAQRAHRTSSAGTDAQST